MRRHHKIMLAMLVAWLLVRVGMSLYWAGEEAGWREGHSLCAGSER